MGRSGISWNICKSFALCSRQITTPGSHHKIFLWAALPATQPPVSKHWRLFALFNIYNYMYMISSSISQCHTYNYERYWGLLSGQEVTECTCITATVCYHLVSMTQSENVNMDFSYYLYNKAPKITIYSSYNVHFKLVWLMPLTTPIRACRLRFEHVARPCCAL